jgi:1,4-dihydroxy-2-naphthoyl-CoA hydrolase
MINTTWTKERINAFNKGTMMEFLDIQCQEVGPDYIIATMPVTSKVKQPMGLMHGGASMVLIESIGSMGSACIIDLEKKAPVGLEINANHIGAIKEGVVKAIGKLIHHGSSTHIWQVDLFDTKSNKLICTGRLTVLIIDKTKKIG